MLRFALKNIAVKRAQVILILISVVVSTGVALLAYNTARQVSEGITGTAGYWSAIIGPAGSKTQLAMNTMYFTDSPLGTVPYSLVTELRSDSRVTQAIPFAMADSYMGYNVVGTEPEFLSGKEIREGRMFKTGEIGFVVLGSEVARACGLKTGDCFYTSHAAGEEHKTPLYVCGILKETHTVYDRQLFTALDTLWEVHEAEEAEEHGEEHDHEEINGMICAVLVRATDPARAMELVNEYHGSVWKPGQKQQSSSRPAHSFAIDGNDSANAPVNENREDNGNTAEGQALQAIEPMDAVRAVLEDADSTRYIVFVLCGIILVMNIVIISVVTLLNLYHSAEEIRLMRLIGISMKKINLLYIVQNGMIGAAAVLLAFITSRLCLGIMNSYAESMGAVLDRAKVYPAEILILLLVLLITMLPTAVCTYIMSRGDGLKG